MSTLDIFPESAGAIDWGERISPGCICVGAVVRVANVALIDSLTIGNL